MRARASVSLPYEEMSQILITELDVLAEFISSNLIYRDFVGVNHDAFILRVTVLELVETRLHLKYYRGYMIGEAFRRKNISFLYVTNQRS